MSTRAVPKKGHATRTARLKQVRKELDRLWQQAVMARDGSRCQLCGATGYAGHHVFTKGSSLATRWDLDNGIAVCLGCHYAIHSSKNCTEYLARIIDAIGVDRFTSIRQRHYGRLRLTLEKAEEIKERLSAI